MNYQKRCLNWVKSSIFYDIGTYIVADAVVGLLQSYNPTLNRYQVVSQRRMQHRVFLTYRDGGDVKHMLSGICALTLGLPFDQSSILVQNIVGVFNIHGNDNNNANRDGRDFQDNAENDVSADYNWKEPDKQTDETNKQSTGDERKQNLCTLVDDFGISPSYQQRIPEVQWPALIRTLRDPSCTTCVISMDQLLEERPNGKRHVVPDVVVLFQRADNAGIVDKSRPLFHAYLFRRNAIEEWFHSSRTPTNPLTRETVDTNTQYFRLS